MGTGARRRPEHLAAKLREIREGLGLSQGELVKRLGLSEHLRRGKISEFERGEREPDLLTLLAYADAAGVCTDVLIDDRLKLPSRLPATPRHKPKPP
jgi:transcriptional regulator with XRE-family HTH domain